MEDVLRGLGVDKSSDDLIVDPGRISHQAATDIFVRAKRGDQWGNWDIACLDAPSLLRWLRSRGGENHWAENVIGIVLGHASPLVP